MFVFYNVPCEQKVFFVNCWYGIGDKEIMNMMSGLKVISIGHKLLLINDEHHCFDLFILIMDKHYLYSAPKHV